MNCLLHIFRYFFIYFRISTIPWDVGNHLAYSFNTCFEWTVNRESLGRSVVSQSNETRVTTATRMLPVWDPGSSYNVVMTMRFCNISYSCRVSDCNVTSTTAMRFYKSTSRFVSGFCNVSSSRFCDGPLLFPATYAGGSLGTDFLTTVYYIWQFICHIFSSQWATRLVTGFPPSQTISKSADHASSSTSLCQDRRSRHWRCIICIQQNVDQWKLGILPTSQYTSEEMTFTPTILNSSLYGQYEEDNFNSIQLEELLIFRVLFKGSLRILDIVP